MPHGMCTVKYAVGRFHAGHLHLWSSSSLLSRVSLRIVCELCELLIVRKL